LLKFRDDPADIVQCILPLVGFQSATVRMQRINTYDIGEIDPWNKQMNRCIEGVLAWLSFLTEIWNTGQFGIVQMMPEPFPILIGRDKFFQI
jgi:hypothetical protein